MIYLTIIQYAFIVDGAMLFGWLVGLLVSWLIGWVVDCLRHLN